MKKYNHKEYIFAAEFECGCCKKRFPMYYVNKGKTYWGNRGRYNFRGAKANFLKHIKACEREKKMKIIEIPKKYKRNIKNRWNIKNAELYQGKYYIYFKCKMCEDFVVRDEDGHFIFSCSKCPFKIYEKIADENRTLGCFNFLSSITDKSHNFFQNICKVFDVSWDEGAHNEVKKIFEIINEKAPNYIKWI